MLKLLLPFSKTVLKRTPSCLKMLFFRRKNLKLFDIPSIEQLRTFKNSPHHWLISDFLQIHHFHYQFFQNRTLKTQTKKQIRIYSLVEILLDNLFTQLPTVWDSNFQNACFNFASQFSQVMKSYFFFYL